MKIDLISHLHLESDVVFLVLVRVDDGDVEIDHERLEESSCSREARRSRTRARSEEERSTTMLQSIESSSS